MNFCRRCKQDFGSTSAFDKHRIGKHAYLWTPERSDGRRCLDTEELAAAGWRTDSHGRWRQPVRYEAVLRVRESRRQPGKAQEGKSLR